MPFDDNLPAAGLKPTTPFSVAHPTTEKEVSVPTEKEHSLAHMATAEPLLDPLGSFSLP